MSLKTYQRKRRFDVTPEPPGTQKPARKRNQSLIYVIQKHRASHLHYDFRLEWDGVLLSCPAIRGRLATFQMAFGHQVKSIHDPGGAMP